MEETDNQHSRHNIFVRWRYTWYGRFAWALVDLVITVIFGGLAINSGTLWQWGIAILFLLNAVYNLVRGIGKLTHGNDNK